ncbi:hypothetical protein SAMN02746065_11880 [Desulfocicer vacuolatum DSM 3385]|uniref:DUF1285 domain-containing protein n=1 Tax=Desulfocicer vacuolatum DSM 3385 TaxID=1121400 RepID=A0A1W2DL41_9BACT|nr:MFS transporter permease [Desulfocicer vacuolatum]SMC98159.1 hypothetical protein SAMN02746065_11880 [Desulfocicer vacuolatum DSM 3385]
MESELKEMIIPKEDALFWLDKNGVWHGENGKFEHPKIIRHFNASIKKDDMGYHLCQPREGFLEKVYFTYEDTALFVIDIIEEKDAQLTLLLSTREPLILEPGQLYTCNDNLYVQTPEHCIKFSQRALVKISAFLEDDGENLCLDLGGVLHEIPEKDVCNSGQ